jgi:hypothetical protein
VVVVPQASDKVRRLFIHPNALMVAFVATIMLLSDGMKGSAAAMEAIADQSIAPSSSSSRLPFFDWAHYQRLINRDGGWESERTLALVAAAVLASIVANDFNLFDKANATLGGGRLTIVGTDSDQARLGEDALARTASNAHATDEAPVAASGARLAHQSYDPGSLPKALAATELVASLLTESDVTIDLRGSNVAMDIDVADKVPGIVDQVFQFLTNMADASPESTSHVYGLALSLIQDLIDSADSLPVTIAPGELLSLLNGVIQTAGLIHEDVAASASSYLLDPGALVIEISGPSAVDTAALFIPESSAPLEPASATSDALPSTPALSTDDGSAGAIPVVSMSTPVVEVDSMSSIVTALRAFLAAAQDVDVVVDNDTIVFVDRSDKDEGATLQIGSSWKMQNDITIMIVGSADTIHAYHEGIAPIA